MRKNRYSGPFSIPPKGTCFRLPTTLAGNTRMKKMTSRTAVSLDSLSTNNPTTADNSRTPVRYTSPLFIGRASGIISTIESVLVKCALRVAHADVRIHRRHQVVSEAGVGPLLQGRQTRRENRHHARHFRHPEEGEE